MASCRLLPMFRSTLRVASSLESRCVASLHRWKSSRAISSVPYIIEETGHGGERVYDIYSRLLKDRIICLMDTVDDHMARSIVAQLLFLQKEDDTKMIKMYINSGGGSVSDGLAIYDTMQHIHAPVSTLCIGQACSMAAVLLAAGKPGHRYALPHSRIMIHQPARIASGRERETDAVIHANEMTKIRKMLNQVLAKHTGQTEETIHKMTTEDTFMSPDEAQKFGIIDKVLA